MENRKDIGKAFREKLDRLDRTAPNTGWNAISGELQEMKMQRGFPWKRAIVSLLVLLAVLVASYPIWKDEVPHVYLEMPDAHKNRESTAKEANAHADGNTIAPGESTLTPENNSLTDNPLQPENSDTGTIITEKQSHVETDLRMTRQSDENTAEASPLNPTVPIPQTPVTEKQADTPRAASPTGDGEGKFKTLDLSKVTYGTDSLKVKKEKKLDTRRIADSLNKLYGREKPVRTRKKSG
ncbi:hypothetical protein [uncultured Flavobacterium sp.]|uniref:hypothetical protein n=1 Tax=uncultured Flavobacterium sp. TaxID=165435 RepID=UPI0025EC3229|nr:hypothetical protein [uncultured Flavobacterium sp.]